MKFGLLLVLSVVSIFPCFSKAIAAGAEPTLIVPADPPIVVERKRTTRPPLLSAPLFGGFIQQETSYEPAGKVQTFIFNMPNLKSPIKFEHKLGFDFSNPDKTEVHSEQYKKDVYALTMISTGIEAKIIRQVPADLSGEKLRDWLKLQTTIVENSVCSNKLVKDRLLQMAKDSVSPREAPPIRILPPNQSGSSRTGT